MVSVQAGTRGQDEWGQSLSGVAYCPAAALYSGILFGGHADFYGYGRRLWNVVNDYGCVFVSDPALYDLQRYLFFSGPF